LIQPFFSLVLNNPGLSLADPAQQPAPRLLLPWSTEPQSLGRTHPLQIELTPCVLCPDADQYKYGKNRVEADAKRLQTKEEELLKRKEALRNRLAQLRKERKDLRAAIEVNAGREHLALTSVLSHVC
jgi:hypothetical protein